MGVVSLSSFKEVWEAGSAIEEGLSWELGLKVYVSFTVNAISL